MMMQPTGKRAPEPEPAHNADTGEIVDVETDGPETTEDGVVIPAAVGTK